MTLYAGASILDISPTKPVALYGYPHVARVSTGIHDPLLASVLYLKHADTCLVMVALDLLFLDPPTSRIIRKRVANALHIAESGVFMSCTHTHSGPVTTRLAGWKDEPPPDPAYLDWLGDRIVEASLSAAAGALPSEMAWSTANATGVGGNRLKIDGITDPECGILAIRDAQTKSLRAVSLIYGMHPTVMHEDSTLISSDFPHYARVHLRERFGETLSVLYHTAPCGNQSPRYFVKGQTFAEAERLGRTLGMAAVAALMEIPDAAWLSAPQLNAALTPVDLPRRQLMPLASASALLDEYRSTYERLKRKGAPRPEVRTAECAVFGAEGTVVLAAAEASGDLARLLNLYKPFEVQLLRLGDVNVVGLPGECFVEYALAIKQGASRQPFVVSLVNGELQGYIVTPEALKAGGYEATNSLFAPEAGTVLVNTALSLEKQMGTKKS